MNEAELQDILSRVQSLVEAETGSRLGAQGEGALAKIIRNVATHNLQGDEGVVNRDVSVLLADLRGFTALSADHPPATVLKLVNRCLITMSEVVLRHRGTIDKFMGDSIMVIFEAASGDDSSARRAVQCAVDLQLAMDELNEYYKQVGLPELFLGIGINSGEVLAGTLGSELYATYTFMGNEVNLAARIEAFSLRGQILVSKATFERCGDFVVAGEPQVVHVKGRKDAIELREIVEIPSLGMAVPRREIRRSPRVKAKMPLTYQRIEGDIAAPEVHRGTVVDIGYHGVQAEFDRPCPALAELKLEIELSVIGCKVTDIYARTTNDANAENGYRSRIEFTSMGEETSRDIQRLVQLLITGSELT